MSKTVKALSTANAPVAIGPYSQAVQAGNFVYVSGQLPIDSATGEFVTGGISALAAQALDNIAAILASDGLSLSDVVKTTILLTDISDFAVVNEVYAAKFTAAYAAVGLNSADAVLPARAAYAVAALPKGATIEIEAIAYRAD